MTISIVLYTQKYVPFPSENANWSQVKYYMGVCDFPCKYQYKILGDTLINSTIYHKIYRQNDSLASDLNAFYWGALRENEKKIYFKYKDCNNEIRLYDFSKNVGDTLNNLYSEMNLCNSISYKSSIITAIDSILIDGSYRKSFHLDAVFNGNLWIEGIGCTNGLFNPVIPPLTCICSWDLVCFHQNNTVKYVTQNSSIKYIDPNIECFPIAINGLNNYNIKKVVSIIPNPITDKSILKWESSEAFATLTITNLLGKIVQTVDVSGKSEISLNKSDFNKGLYFGRIVSGRGSKAIVKIIVE